MRTRLWYAEAAVLLLALVFASTAAGFLLFADSIRYGLVGMLMAAACWAAANAVRIVRTSKEGKP